MIYPDGFINKIIQGDVMDIMKKIPDNSIDCIITSPPYWNCRTYLPEQHPNKTKEIGTEKHPQQYIDRIVEISLECVRVLKKTGVFFINLGDVYYNKEMGKYKDSWIKPKGRLLLPLRIAVELQDRGIIIRDIIVWVKK